MKLWLNVVIIFQALATQMPVLLLKKVSSILILAMNCIITMVYRYHTIGNVLPLAKETIPASRTRDLPLRHACQNMHI
jgi:hypothetical protein